MKKNMKKILIFAFMLFAISASAYAKSKAMYVCVKQAQLKTGTGFFARTCGTLKYADKVNIIEKNGKWAKVSSARKPSLKGWLPIKSLTRKKLIAKSKGTSANTDELALAGKGLTEGTGNEFKSRGKRDYKGVNAIEAINTPPYQLKKFIDDGKLKVGE